MRTKFKHIASIHFQLPGTPEMFEAEEYHNHETRTILIAYQIKYLNDYGGNEPITKQMLRFIKNQYKPFALIVRTNAGLELHHSEIAAGEWNGIKIEKVLKENVFLI